MPPLKVVRPLTVMAAVLVSVPLVMVNVVASSAIVPKLSVPDCDNRVAPMEGIVPVKLTMPLTEASIVVPVTS